jgi:hypothetical protein
VELNYLNSRAPCARYTVYKEENSISTQAVDKYVAQPERAKKTNTKEIEGKRYALQAAARG